MPDEIDLNDDEWGAVHDAWEAIRSDPDFFGKDAGPEVEALTTPDDDEEEDDAADDAGDAG